MASGRTVTLQDVARESGVSVSAVSYALRGAANIPAETAARVRAAADKLGYRPNARVGELMAHIRLGRPLAKAEPLALVYLDGDLKTSAKNGFGLAVATAAREHAAKRGYRLDTFWLSEVEGNTRRLAGILTARGISGVLFAPTVRRERIELEWPWENFAVAVIGMSELNEPLPRAGHHHYEAMREVLRRVAATGVKRPVAMIEFTTNERAHRGWQAAWLACAPGNAVKRLWLDRESASAGAGPRERGADKKDGEQERRALADWLSKSNADALIVDGPSSLAKAKAAGWSALDKTFTLAWTPDSRVAGIEQGYDAISAHAVDLVVTQLQRNERGLPNPPPMLLFPGRWRE